LSAHEQAEHGEWDVSAIAQNAYGLEGKVVDTLGADRIGRLVLQRLKPFNLKELLYYGLQPNPCQSVHCSEKEHWLVPTDIMKTWPRSSRCAVWTTYTDFLGQYDVLMVNMPLQCTPAHGG